MEPAPITKISEFLDIIFRPLMTKIVVALLILLVGFILGRLVGKIIQRLLHEIEVNKIISIATGLKISLEEIISTAITYFIYFVGIVMALDQMGLKTYVLNILTAGVVIIIVLSIFLGIKDFIPNVMAGLVIHSKGFVKVGDRIRFHGIEGRISHINLVETRIRTKQGDMIYIPNSLLTKEELVKKR